MNTFNPLRLPRILTTNSKINSNENEFGDGYSHCVCSGINNKVDELSMSWEGLTFADAKTITDFFASQNSESFIWIHPTTNIQCYWRCIDWSTTAAENHITLEATFKQAFN